MNKEHNKIYDAIMDSIESSISAYDTKATLISMAFCLAQLAHACETPESQLLDLVSRACKFLKEDDK